MRAPGIPRPRTEGTRPAGASPGLVCGLQPGGEAVLAAVCVPQPRQVDRRRGVAHRVLLCRPVTGREVIAPSLVGSRVSWSTQDCRVCCRMQTSGASMKSSSVPPNERLGIDEVHEPPPGCPPRGARRWKEATAPILVGGDRPPLAVLVSPEPTVMIFPMPWSAHEAASRQSVNRANIATSSCDI